MAINAYEGMFILDSNRFARDQAAAVKWIQDLIESAGGEVLVSRLWDERRLAYPINGHRKGTYWLTYFKIDGTNLAGMTRECEIGDLVLRHLFLKIHPAVIDALVEHAASSAKATSPKAESSKSEDDDDDDSDSNEVSNDAESEAETVAEST
ncbi:MAG: 30S ribosomal protein S6 [Planctomycetales bacterium]|nr:30S ribosomal protein S6 [Planctomycetales bacterium]